MRKTDRQVRGDAGGGGSFVECLRRAVRAGECVAARVADARHVELARASARGAFRASCTIQRARRAEPIRGNAQATRSCSAATDSPSPRYRGPESAIGSSSGNRFAEDGKAPLVEDALQPGQPPMQTERTTARVASDLEHLTGGHGDGGAGDCNRTGPDTARRYSARRFRPRDTRRRGCETALPARGRCRCGTPAP